jgi:MFS family permease
MHEIQDIAGAALPLPKAAPLNARWSALFGRDYVINTLMLCIGVGLYAFNAFLVSTTLPSAVAEIGGARLLPWASTLYLAASIVAGASAAALKSRIGSRQALIGTTVVFLLGTLLAANASSMAGVIAGRVLQGLGEGVVAAVCYMLIPEIYPRHLIAKVFGLEACVWALAAFGGPALAGLVTETVSWRAAFLVNIPIIAIFLLTTAFVATPRTLNVVKSNIPAGRLALLLFAFVMLLGANLTVLEISRNTMIGLAVATLILFVMLDKWSLQSILPRGAFSANSPVGLGLWTVLLMPLAQASSRVYLVYSLQHLWQIGPTAAGTMGAMTALSWSATAIGVANITNERAQKALIVAGVMVEACGMAGVAFAIQQSSLPLLMVSLIGTGAAFGMSWSFLNQTLMMASPETERDRTSALLPTLQAAGYALGAAFAGLVANGGGFSQSAPDEVVRQAISGSFFFGFWVTLPAIVTAILMLLQLRKNR